MNKDTTIQQISVRTISLNNITAKDIVGFPIKLQIFFILKFCPLKNEKEFEKFIEIINSYDKENEINNDVIEKILKSCMFVVNGLFYNTKISSDIIFQDYLDTWKNIIKKCVYRTHNYFGSEIRHDIVLDLHTIILICERFDIPIKIKDIVILTSVINCSEDCIVYLIKSSNTKIDPNDNDTLLNLMGFLENIYWQAIHRKQEVLAKVIRTMPFFVSTLNTPYIKKMIEEYPYVLNYNFNKNPIDFKILTSEADVISVKLRALSIDQKLKNFSSTNKIISIILENKIKIPNDKNYNKVFYNYILQIYNDLNKNLEKYEYDENTNYSEELLKLHIEIMSGPIVEL